jgi:hypothetical protein
MSLVGRPPQRSQSESGSWSATVSMRWNSRRWRVGRTRRRVWDVRAQRVADEGQQKVEITERLRARSRVATRPKHLSGSSPLRVPMIDRKPRAHMHPYIHTSRTAPHPPRTTQKH